MHRRKLWAAFAVALSRVPSRPPLQIMHRRKLRAMSAQFAIVSETTTCTGMTFQWFPSCRSSTSKRHLKLLKSLILPDIERFSNVFAPCQTPIRSILDLKKKPFWILISYHFWLCVMQTIIKIVCFTVPLVVHEFSIPEHNKSILGKILRPTEGLKITETF